MISLATLRKGIHYFRVELNRPGSGTRVVVGSLVLMLVLFALGIPALIPWHLSRAPILLAP